MDLFGIEAFRMRMLFGEFGGPGGGGGGEGEAQ